MPCRQALKCFEPCAAQGRLQGKPNLVCQLQAGLLVMCSSAFLATSFSVGVSLYGAQMSASNPSSNSKPTADSAPSSTNNATNGSVSGGGGGAENLVVQRQLSHDPGLSLDWSAEEQATLEDGLSKYVNEASLVKYLKIANELPEKTVRDVALRCKWMTKKENGKRRKADEQMNRSKIKDAKKEKYSDPSSRSLLQTTRSAVPMYTPPPPPVDNDDGISNDAIGGTTGKLFEQNAQVITQIRTNLATCKLQENTELLSKFRDNLLAIMEGMTNVPGIMSQMPALPVPLNSELADSILPKPPLPSTSTPLAIP